MKMMMPMKRDDERHEYRRLEGQLDALEEDIQAARRALERATSAHFEDFFSGAPLRAHPEEIAVGERVTLRDGSTVMIRPVRPADTSLVTEGFEHLSAVTRYRKFLFDRRLTASVAEDVTHLDRDHDALGAIDPVTGAGVGLARCVRESDDPKRATAAVIVVDGWQKRGLGTRLLKRLADRARAAGIECFESHMIVGDTTAKQVFESVGTVQTTERARGVLDVTVRLSDQPQVSP
jgi:GNAT superfamily N-acetyltransferase